MKSISDPTTILIQQSEYREVSWKNGKGKSSEIALYPKNENIEGNGFSWRLSTASIVGNSEFSKFPSYDRILVVLNGEGIRLCFQDKSYVLLKQDDIFRFSGDESLLCELLSTEVKDLNLIYRRSEIQTSCELVSVSNKARSFQVEGDTILVFSRGGRSSVSVYPGEKKFQVNSGATLKIDYSKELSQRERLILIEPSEESSFVIFEIKFLIEYPEV